MERKGEGETKGIQKEEGGGGAMREREGGSQEIGIYHDTQ